MLLSLMFLVNDEKKLSVSSSSSSHLSLLYSSLLIIHHSIVYVLSSSSTLNFSFESMYELTILIAIPIKESWMFLIQIEAFDDFNTISKYTPAKPDVKHPLRKSKREEKMEVIEKKWTNSQRGWQSTVNKTREVGRVTQSERRRKE